MNHFICLLLTDSFIVSWIFPQTMKGTGLHRVTWLTTIVSGSKTGGMLVGIIIIFAVEAVFLLLAKAIVGRMYIGIVRRMQRYGCEKSDLMLKIDHFHIPESLKRRLKTELIESRDDKDTSDDL